jgi:putative tricarboxylic transport membrane protein
MKGEEQTIVVTAEDSSKKLHLFSLIKKNLLRIIRWGFIGVGIGAVPGVGENIAAWVAYGDAKRSCENGKDFGTGVYEGVMAPETANNAAIGGAIIPLVSLA